MSYRFDCGRRDDRSIGIKRAVELAQDGKLIVLPVDSGYGLGCDAFIPSAVQELAAARGSSRAQPPPVLIPHARTLDGIATEVPMAARDLMAAFWPGALTLICRAQPSLSWDLGDTRGTVSARVPLHPVALQVLAEVGPMAVTSASPAGWPAPATCDSAQEALGDSIGVYLDAGPMTDLTPSSVVDCTGSRLRALRLGAIGLAELRAVVPDLLGPDDPEPEPEPAPEPEPEAEPAPEAEPVPEAEPEVGPEPARGGEAG